MNGLQIFKDTRFGEIRVHADNDGEPMFCAADVCKALGYANTRDAVYKHTDEGDVAKRDTPTSSGIQTMTFVNESGLYSLIFGSKLESAKVFKKWVTSEVLPSIRKHGLYATEPTIDRIIDDPEFGIKLLTQLKEERKAKEIAQKEAMEKAILLDTANETISKQTPKVDYYDNVLMSVATMTTTQVAKAIGRSAVWLNKQLKKCGIIFYQSGQWMLKTPYDKWKLHSVRTATYTHSDGRITTKSATVWTERGKRFIIALHENGFQPKLAVSMIKGEMKKEMNTLNTL